MFRGFRAFLNEFRCSGFRVKGGSDGGLPLVGQRE